MKLVRPKYEIIEQGPGLQGIYDIIEKCGKTSYKSEVKGGSAAKTFTDARAKEGHGAVLEFGTVYLDIELQNPLACYKETYEWSRADAISFYETNSYSKVVKFGNHRYITTNYRVIVENNRLDDLKYLCEPTEYHKRRHTVRFISDIGVGREFLRHRVMSMVQESTRWVDYARDKFGNECTFVIPSWIKEYEVAEGDKIEWWDGDWIDMNTMEAINRIDGFARPDINAWLNLLYASEETYKSLISQGWLAEQARTVLPLATKTEYDLCGFTDAWVHFFQLRSDVAKTGKPHPQALELANPLRDEFIERGFFSKKDLEGDESGAVFDVCSADNNLKLE